MIHDTPMIRVTLRLIFCGILLLVGPIARAADPAPWLGVHVMVSNNDALDTLAAQLPALAQRGVNHLILEIGYSFDFKSRPEMADPNGITASAAHKFAAAARAQHIEIIPQINCLGHQSWKKYTGTLLRKHPELDETPGKYPENEGIYCRSWCPQNPQVYKILFPMMDELIDAFDAKAFHVGMDEVFIIASDDCPRCHGKDPAAMFALAVNKLHDHLVGQRHVQMYMWGDRLLDAKAVDSSKWEASANGTWPAIERIPKDIIICDWHYERRDAYPSLDVFIHHGFRVIASGWKNVDAANAFAADALKHHDPHMLGYLCTTWGAVKPQELSDWPALVQPLAKFDRK